MLAVVLIDKIDMKLAPTSLLWAQKSGSILTDLGHEVHYLDLFQEEPVLSTTLELTPSSTTPHRHLSQALKVILQPAFQKADLVLNTIGSNLVNPGSLENLLELCGLRTLSNPSSALATCCNKVMMRTLAQASVNVLPTLTVSRTYSPQLLQEIAQLGPQALIRKNHTFDSKVTLIDTSDELGIQTLLDQALEHHLELTVEPFIPGRFFSVAIVGKRTLSCREFKYQASSTPRELIETTISYSPAHLPSTLQRQMQQHARHLHALTGCRYLSECDFHLSEDGEIRLVNFHAHPLLKDPFAFLESLQAHGLSNSAFLQHLIDLSLAYGSAYPSFSNLALNEQETVFSPSLNQEGFL